MTTDGIPRLSQTTINWIVNSSPLHAWWNHPVLNPDYEPEVSKQIEIGQICHERILRGRDVTVVLDYNDYRTNAAQEARDQARRDGKWPILRKDVERVDDIVEATFLQLHSHHDMTGAFRDGDAEVHFSWKDPETGIDCKARLDYLSKDHRRIWDLKCTSGSAHPEMVTKRIFQNGYDVQGCFYIEAVQHFYNVSDVEFYLVTVETEAPYGLSVVGLDPSVKWLGQKKIEVGKKLWKEALATHTWPGYPRETCWATLPVWAEKAWLEKEEKDAV